MEEKLYWLGFSLFSGIGPVTFGKLLAKFGSAKTAWSQPAQDLEPILGKLTEKFVNFKSSFPFDAYQKELKRKEVWFLTLLDKEYPQLLKQTKKPPFVLFGKGSTPVVTSSTIAVVGTRKITEYGREITQVFTTELVRSGFTIVSGLALGVDATAHITTLENNGKTIAVLGCGVDCCTPSENQFLYDEILQNGGVIVSEFPLRHPPTMGSFPARNRIIAGLSLGVLVTEGAEDSGSLITAEYALSESRMVFAIPGPITSDLSRGPLTLIRKGAKLVTSAEDIIKNFQFSILNFKSNSKSQIQKTKTGTKEEKKILDLLGNEALHFDAIVRKAGISSSKLGSLLTLMEIEGKIKSLGALFHVV